MEPSSGSWRREGRDAVFATMVQSSAPKRSNTARTVNDICSLVYQLSIICLVEPPFKILLMNFKSQKEPFGGFKL